jgi:hypothetical protein
MPVPTSTASWWVSLLWLIALAAGSFGVAWLSGTRLHIRKGPYVPLLLAVTVAFVGGYLAWLDVDVTDVVTARWGWGIVAGVAIAALLVRPAQRQPVDHPLVGRARVAALGWQGVAYGAAEGLLLSALPPFMAWQLVHSLGWSGAPGAVARWTLPVLAGAAVIVIHHLGYWSCRNRILVPITLALSVLSVGFLVTGSWLAPVIAHIGLHGVLIVHGSEMPPHDRPRPAQLRPVELAGRSGRP